MALPQAPAPARRSALWLTIAAVAVLLIIATVVMFMTRPDKPGAEDSPPAGETTIAPATTATAVPTSAPAGITWSLVGQSAVPTSPADGPANINGCQASGYTHSPVGALVAAAQISTRSGYYAGRSCWEPTVTSQFVASADRDALLKILRDADAQKVPGAAPGELSQLAAFRFISFTSDTAVIGLVRRTPQGSFAQTTLTLTWTGGDWSLVAPSAGQWPTVTTTVTSLAGSIAWGAS